MIVKWDSCFPDCRQAGAGMTRTPKSVPINKHFLKYHFSGVISIIDLKQQRSTRRSA
jgi:hypothetical protein